MEAVRRNFMMFGNQPTSPGSNAVPTIVPLYKSLSKLDCSGAVSCAGLERKTVQIVADPADLAAKPIKIQATMFAESHTGWDAEWVDVSVNITVSGIYLITLMPNTTNTAPLTATYVPLEPELTYLRIISTVTQQGLPLGLPLTLKARLGGYWGGEGKWKDRISIHYPLNSPCFSPDGV